MIRLIVIAWLGVVTTEHAMPCWMIAAYVKAYGSQEAAIRAAKAYGWTDSDIAKVKRRCKL